MKRIAFFFAPLLIALLLLFLVGCGGSETDVPTEGGTAGEPTDAETTAEPTAAPGDGYTVTFSLPGGNYDVIVAPGETPVYPGTTPDDNRTDGLYRFSHWDPAPVPADGDALYTAVYERYEGETVKIRWVVETGVVTTVVPVGEVPVPPAALEEPIYTASTVCTFTGWTPELVAATKTTAYTAQYTRAPRTYTVRFTLGGKTVGEKVLPYGSEITFDRTVDVPAGYNDVLWYGLAETVKGDTVLEGIFTVNDAPSLEYALNSSYISYDPQGDDDNLGDVMNEASALLLLIDESRHNENPIFASRAAEHLRYMISSSGVAPYFDLEPYWNYVHVTAAITLAHETPAVWDQLTSDEQSTYDFIMATFAALLTLGTSDQNDYKTGPGFTGNFNKNWNPNFRLSVVLPMLFAGRYFGGAEKLNQVLASFSYDETVARFAASPCFARAYARWTVEPGRFSDGTKAPNQKTIMENGGPAYVVKYDSAGNRVSITGGDAAGTGQGVRVPYLYQGYTVDNVNSIMTYLIGVNYGGGNVASRMGDDGSGNPLAYILDGTNSPVQGMNGMMKEFNSSDAKGLRSSAVYCTADFEMVCAALYCLEELSMYTPDQRDASFKMMVVGNADLIYKLEHGYRSYSLGKGSDSYEKTSSAYMLWKAWWLNRYGQVDPKKL